MRRRSNSTNASRRTRCAIERRLEKVRKQREQGRRQRQRAAVATVALVGYTNAGKSTLFNQLTSAGVLAVDRLFATLDPTLRKLPVNGTAKSCLPTQSIHSASTA